MGKVSPQGLSRPPCSLSPPGSCWIRRARWGSPPPRNTCWMPARRPRPPAEYNRSHYSEVGIHHSFQLPVFQLGELSLTVYQLYTGEVAQYRRPLITVLLCLTTFDQFSKICPSQFSSLSRTLLWRATLTAEVPSLSIKSSLVAKYGHGSVNNRHRSTLQTFTYTYLCTVLCTHIVDEI